MTYETQNSNNNIKYDIKCFQREDIEAYFGRIIDMQYENTYMFHYPDKIPNKDYIKKKIQEISTHLNNGNTYFIGAKKGAELYGYIWGYEGTFIDEKRMNINSLFVCEEARRTGLGNLLINYLKKIAIDNCCDSIGTHYASFNVAAGEFYSKHEFNPTRIEMVCELKMESMEEKSAVDTSNNNKTK